MDDACATVEGNVEHAIQDAARRQQERQNASAVHAFSLDWESWLTATEPRILTTRRIQR